MNVTVAAILAVISSSDICDDPFTGGIGEPDYCKISQRQLIITPNFAFVAEPGVLVGVDRNGNRVIIESSIRQSQINVYIEAHPKDDYELLLGQISKNALCGAVSDVSLNLIACDRSANSIKTMSYLYKGESSVVVAFFTATPLAAEQVPIFEKIILSIDPNGT